MVTEQEIQLFISPARFRVYLQQRNHDVDAAYQLYLTNIELSEALYPVLSVLEISLRNAIHQKLSTYFNDPYWFKNKLPSEFQVAIKRAEQKISLQQKQLTPDRIIAELNFGFWNRLFNRHYARQLWKPLRTIFPHLPKQQRRRDTIDDALFRIRTLRNRIYHYAPIFHNLQYLEMVYGEIYLFLSWLHHNLPAVLHNTDRFQQVVLYAKRQC
jgi:hypothetical protein